ncbi:MAG: DNA-binding protein [Burkholderiales bacterium]|nr:DNA-binding protein [Burkholderiales bacterium]
MSLENLVLTGQLKKHVPDREQVALLLAAADRNLVDARHGGTSTETRFDCGYKALMQAALVALLASGFRPDNKRPGHHAVVIQSLALTLGVAGTRIATLDKLREKRNLSDYTGAPLDEVATEACVDQATRLLAELRQWLSRTHPELI